MAQSIKNLIGKAVRYRDYLDIEQYGRIVAVEELNSIYNPEIIWVYIENNDPNLNIHSFDPKIEQRLFTAGVSDIIHFADICLSPDVIIDE